MWPGTSVCASTAAVGSGLEGESSQQRVGCRVLAPSPMKMKASNDEQGITRVDSVLLFIPRSRSSLTSHAGVLSGCCHGCMTTCLPASSDACSLAWRKDQLASHAAVR